MTNGCFDIIHPGHIKIFEESKKLGDKLIVLVNTDKSVKKLKGETRPIISLKSRLKILSSIEHKCHPSFSSLFRNFILW